MSGRWEAHVTDWSTWMRAADRSPGTIRTRVEHVRWLERDTTAAAPWTLTTDDLVTWIGSHDWARETMRGVRNSLRGFWTWGISDGRTTTDPTADLPAPRASIPAPHPTPESAYATALHHATRRERAMLMLAAEVGLRRFEVAQVHARDVVEVPGGGWTLIVHGKGGRERRMPLPRALAWELRTLAQGGFAFPGKVDGHVSAWWVGKLVSRLLPDGYAMHSLRHRFGSMSYAKSHDMLAVQKLLGHASPTTTQVYVLVPDDDLRTIVDAVASSRGASGFPTITGGDYRAHHG